MVLTEGVLGSRVVEVSLVETLEVVEGLAVPQAAEVSQVESQGAEVGLGVLREEGLAGPQEEGLAGPLEAVAYCGYFVADLGS